MDLEQHAHLGQLAPDADHGALHDVGGGARRRLQPCPWLVILRLLPLIGAEMLSLETVRGKRRRLLDLAKRHGARNVRVFGSVSRNEAGDSSDLDLLVDLEPGRSLIDLGALLADLEAELGSRVDLVTEAGLRPALRERVLRDAMPL